jgi:hypothetical protein
MDTIRLPIFQLVFSERYAIRIEIAKRDLKFPIAAYDRQ